MTIFIIRHIKKKSQVNSIVNIYLYYRIVSVPQNKCYKDLMEE